MRSKSKYIFPVLICLLALAAGAAVILRAQTPDSPQPSSSPSGSGKLELHILDTGDSDAILAITPEGGVMLVDTGLDETYGHVYAALKELGISRIDALVLTHPHKDHIGGAPQLLTDFSVKQVFMPSHSHSSERVDALNNALEKAGLSAQKIQGGDSFGVASLQVRVLSPKKTYENINDNSAVLQFTYGEKTFLLMGDAEKEAESELIELYDNGLRADFIKAGHHGAKDASGKDFLAIVQPVYAAITGDHAADPDHVHQKTLERYQAAGATVYRTDRDGDIAVFCDGKSIAVQTER